MVAVGVGLSAGWLLKPESDASPVQPVTDRAETENNPSIAVLAFENMSPDPDNAFFAEGISEEILNVLAGVDALRVASRTSAFSLSDLDLPIPEIADRLGVAHVLEGSVRKSGNRVRITAQLIDASNDAHLWSDVYDRELIDIFAVQEDIARAITGELTSLLAVESVNVSVLTDNMVAYEEFLSGRSKFYERSIDSAAEDLERAVRRDPEFAEAWAFLGATQFNASLGGWGTAMVPEEARQAAARSADRALALDPDLPLAQTVKGRLMMSTATREGIEEGLRLMKTAASNTSADTTPKLWLGSALLRLGDLAGARDIFAQAQEKDPLVAINNGYLAAAYTALGQIDTGWNYTKQATELSTSTGYWVELIAIESANAGDRATAIAMINETRDLMLEPPERHMTGLLIALEQGLGYDEYLQLDQAPPEGAFGRTMAALMLGDFEAALSPDEGMGGPRTAARSFPILFSAWYPSMVALREHPEFFQLVNDLGFVDYWRANGFPLDCREFDGEGPARLDCGGGE
jgi:TolB-like protein